MLLARHGGPKTPYRLFWWVDHSLQQVAYTSEFPPIVGPVLEVFNMRDPIMFGPYQVSLIFGNSHTVHCEVPGHLNS